MSATITFQVGVPAHNEFVSVMNGWSIKETANGRNTCRFRMLAPARIPEFDDSIVIVRDGTTRIFGGTVVTTTERGIDAGSGSIIYEVNGIDFNALCDRVYVRDSDLLEPVSFPAQSLKDNLIQLVSYIPFCSIDPSQATGPTLPAMEFTTSRPVDILKQFSLASGGWLYNLDYLQLLSMIEPGAAAGVPVLAPFNVTAGDGRIIGDATSEPITADYYNRIIAQGAGGLISVQEDSGEIAAHGPHELLVQFPDVSDQTTLDDLTTEYLEKSVVVMHRGQYMTYIWGVHPNQTQTLALPLRDLVGDFLVTDVEIKHFEGTGGTSRVEQTISLLEGSKYKPGWRDKLFISATGGAVVTIGGIGGGGGGVPADVARQSVTNNFTAVNRFQAQVNFDTWLSNTKLALYDDGAGDVYGFGIQTNQFRFHLGSATAKFSFLTAPGGTEIFTINGDGTIIGGTYNGQTVSSAANFTGTVAAVGPLSITSAAGTNAIANLSAPNTFAAVVNFKNAGTTKAAVGKGTVTGGNDLELYSVSDSIVFFPNNTTARHKMHASGGLSVGDLTDPGATNFRVAGTSALVGTVTVSANVVVNPAAASASAVGFKVGGVGKAAMGLSGAILGDSSTHAAIFSETGAGIRFYTDGSAAMKVGIGTTGAITPSTYAAGFAGNGYTLDYDASYASQSFFEVDRMSVRGIFSVYELLVHQVRATNGSIFVSNTGKAKTVTNNGGGSYTIETDMEHGFLTDDLIRAQRFTGTGTYQSDMTVTAAPTSTNFTATLRSTYTAPTAGMEFVRLGSTSDASRRGSIYMTADDANAPYINILSGVAAFTDWGASANTRVRIGNLKGWSDYAAELYGAAFGDAAATNITIDAANGFRVRYGTTNKLVANTSGDLSLVGDLTVGTSGKLRSGASNFTTGTGYYFDISGSDARARIGTVSGNRITWDGADLTVVSANVTIDNSGISVPVTTAFPSPTYAYRFSPVTVQGTTVGLFSFETTDSYFGSSAARRVLYMANATTNNSRGVLTTMSATNNGSASADITLEASPVDQTNASGMHLEADVIQIEGHSIIALNGAVIDALGPLNFGTILGNTIVALYDDGAGDSIGLGVQSNRLLMHLGTGGSHRFAFYDDPSLTNEVATISKVGNFRASGTIQGDPYASAGNNFACFDSSGVLYASSFPCV